jgi:DNA-binding response OmpR family regulator
MRVLVVEDHNDSREFLGRLLRRWNFDVVTADCLEQGIASLEGHRFDAIISDISLPDGTGYALITEAKARDKGVLGIALSGYASPLDIAIGVRMGFDHYLTKPFDCGRIRTILSAVTTRDAEPV